MRTSRMAFGLAAGVLAVAVWLAGCGPSGPTIQQVMASRPDKTADYNACAKVVKDRFLGNRKHKDYVVWAMEYASLCLMGGNLDAARAELMECFQDIRRGTGGEVAAAIGAEAAKRFKGEPFERAMVCCYLGLIHYMQGDYENARVFFTQANMQDATTGENMAAFRDDFALAHYWLGRTYGKLGDEDNCRIAFTKAGKLPPLDALVKGPVKVDEKAVKKYLKQAAEQRARRARLEKLCYKNATTGKNPIPEVADMSEAPPLNQMPDRLPGAGEQNPVLATPASFDEFLKPEFQKDVNLTLMIEVGLGPVKMLIGEHKEQDVILPATFEDKTCLVYLNGHKAGPAWRMVDLFFQAATRGTGEKDVAQATKGVGKSIIKSMPYVGDLAGLWDIRADERYWHLVPGEVHVFAAKVKPGLHTINLQVFDVNGYLLPRYRLTRYHIPVRQGAENIYLLHIQPEVDNVYAARK